MRCLSWYMVSCVSRAARPSLRAILTGAYSSAGSSTHSLGYFSCYSRSHSADTPHVDLMRRCRMRRPPNESLQLTRVLAPLPLTLLPNDHGVSIDASIRTTSGPQVQRRV